MGCALKGRRDAFYLCNSSTRSCKSFRLGIRDLQSEIEAPRCIPAETHGMVYIATAVTKEPTEQKTTNNREPKPQPCRQKTHTNQKRKQTRTFQYWSRPAV